MILRVVTLGGGGSDKSSVGKRHGDEVVTLLLWYRTTLVKGPSKTIRDMLLSIH
jgi:hypothetical protein